MSVKRYDLCHLGGGLYSMMEDSDGEFVRHVDHTSLEQKLADMAVQLANAESKCRELAAENAELKSGFKYFSYSEMAGFEEHDTAESAMKSADADLSGERDEASSEGWSEETDTICWGVIVQKAVENKFEKPSEENGWIGWSDYALLPPIETPETDSFLAEVRAQARNEFINELESRFNEMTETLPPELRSGAAGAAAFVSTFRKGAAL